MRDGRAACNACTQAQDEGHCLCGLCVCVCVCVDSIRYVNVPLRLFVDLGYTDRKSDEW